MKNFPRQNLIILVLLTMITLGLYLCYWMQKKVSVINELLPEHRIWPYHVPLYWVISLSGIFWYAAEWYSYYFNEAYFELHYQNFEDVGARLDLMFMVYSVFLAFGIRNRINIITGAAKGASEWLYGGWTLIFGAFYLQHRINESHN